MALTAKEAISHIEVLAMPIALSTVLRRRSAVSLFCMAHNDKWTELVGLLEKGLHSLPTSNWRPDLRREASFDAKLDALGRVEFHDTTGLNEAIDVWLDTQDWKPSLSAKHLYCLRNRLFVSWFFARHIPFASPNSETLIPFPLCNIRDACHWYLVEWYERRGMLLLAEGQLPDTFDYGRN